MIYSNLVRRYFEAAPNAGELAGPGVFRGAAGKKEQGIWVQFDLQMHSGMIVASRFLAFGCPHTVAVSSWVAEQVQGSALQRQLPESVQQLRERFEVPVEKMGRILIVEDAWQAAVVAAVEYRD